MSDDLWQKLMDDYTRYNQYVDVVSCWESLLKAEFDSDQNFNFDRFPNDFHTENGNQFKPDFSVQINEDYGILFEIKRTVGGGEEGYESTIDQLEHYLEEISHISDGSRFPENKDVVFLVKENNARRIAIKVREGLEERGVDTDDLIILYYSSDTIDTIFCYIFKKVDWHSPDFSDECFDDTNPLNGVFGEENDYEGIRSSTRRFWPYRSRCPIMNDSPPPVYLASLLWMDHFYDLLTKDQKADIRSGMSHQKVKIDMDELYEMVREDFPIKKGDLRKTMDFLVEGNLAEESDEEDFDYTLKYQRLKSTREIQTKQKREGKRQKLKELSKKFINHYIKYHEGERAREEEKKETEEFIKKSLLDF